MHKQSTHRTILRALCRCLVKRQQLLGVAQSMISNMTFVAIHILSPDHCALNGISEVSSPKEYPTSENTDRWVRSRQGVLGGLGGCTAEVARRIKQPNHELLALRKSDSADKRIRAGWFWQATCCVSCTNFFFPLQQPLNNWVGASFHISWRGNSCQMFFRGVSTLCLPSTHNSRCNSESIQFKKISVRRHWQGLYFPAGLIVCEFLLLSLQQVLMKATRERKGSRESQGKLAPYWKLSDHVKVSWWETFPFPQ